MIVHMFVLGLVVVARVSNAQTGSQPDNDDSNEVATSNRSARLSSCHWREIDLCYVSASSLLQSPHGLPLTNAQFARQCELLEDAATCLDTYARQCMSRQQFALIHLFGARELAELGRELCADDPNSSPMRTAYERHKKCLNAFQRSHQNKCARQLQAGLEPIARAESGARLRIACW